MTRNSTENIVIAGAGPAGLGLANKLNKPFTLLEAEDLPGGLMRSKNVSGYTFDWAGHIFFTQFQRIKSWVETLMQDNFHWQNRESWIFSQNAYTRYPFQANTYGLPLPAVKECLMGLIEATCNPGEREPENFKEWILETYGPGIAKHFMLPYNTKLWARDIATMDHHWLAGRVPKPGLSEFIDGALGPGRKDMGPNARFGYPLHGGTQALVDKLTQPVQDKISLNKKVISVDPENQVIEIENGGTCSYDQLVLTIPLPHIGQMTRNIDPHIKSRIDSLEYISVLCVNVGVKRPEITDKNWIYFPEEDFLFHRIFVQGNTSPHVCPDGSFSYTAEITYNDQKKVDFATAGEKTVEGMIRAGLLDASDTVDVVDLIDIPVAYVVPTHNRKDVIAEIKAWYAERNIHLLGRFAEWQYFNMDHALDAGWHLADVLNEM